ncbi:MAG: hypothetical protein K6E30_10955 [Lachnospiraceae bacterium]|nr:hypothetical protein [Lachnospiraceae bacterium]
MALSITKLRDFAAGRKRKTISKSELEDLLHCSSDAELYRLVSEAVLAGAIAPVKASGTNGNRVYPIYLKYRLTVIEDYSEALSEIAMLHPDISRSGYLQSKPALYLQYREALQKLNRFLFKAGSPVPIARKERSFDLFGEEKALEDGSFLSLLEHLGLTAERLCYYDTPEYCFNDYIPVRKEAMTLLICENKDIWFNIRRRMYEDGASMIFGQVLDGVVYGSGGKVSKKGALSAYTRFLGAGHVRYLYWGDIDRAGLTIYQSLRRGNPELDLSLFKQAYEEMLRLSAGRAIPDSRDQREARGDYTELFALFSGELREILIASIEANKRIPQEIINYETLLEIMR